MEESATNIDDDREAKRAKLISPAADPGAGAGDLISGLCDDMLLRILGQVANAIDVVTTGALSRRWRGLWTRAPALRFGRRWRLRPTSDEADAGRFIACVSGALALRAAQPRDATIEHLEISLADLLHDDGRLSTVRAAEEWFRYVARQAVKSFCLELRLPYRPVAAGEGEDDEEEEEEEAESEWRPVMDLGELPSSAKLETMRLEIDGSVRVRLPSTAVFASLADLTLKFVTVAAGSGEHFARLLSSACCPRLQKLCMCCVGLPAAMPELLLDAGALSELWLDEIYDMRWLDLRTPGLRVLRIEECYELDVLTVAAPRLQELTFTSNPQQVHIDGDLSSVQRLELDLRSYRHSEDHESSISLLQLCSSARCVDMSLEFMAKYVPGDLIKGRIAELPQVTSLTVHVSPIRGQQAIGEHLASVLKIFRNLVYLCLDLGPFMKPDPQRSGPDFTCDDLDRWKSHEISFAHLQKAEFRSLTGAEHELRYLQFLLASARQIQTVVVSFNQHYKVEGKQRDDFQRMLLFR